MSHEFITRDFLDVECNTKEKKAKINKWFDDYVSKATWQEGGGGCGPIRWIDNVCASRETAEKYLESHQRYAYDQMAVKYMDYSGCKTPTKVAALEKRASDLYTKYREKCGFAFAGNKSEFRGCPKCGSKLSLKYLKANKCPLCFADLRSETAIKAEQNAYAAWQKAAKEADEERTKPRKGGKVCWLVSVEYHM